GLVARWAARRVVERRHEHLIPGGPGPGTRRGAAARPIPACSEELLSLAGPKFTIYRPSSLTGLLSTSSSSPRPSRHSGASPRSMFRTAGEWSPGAPDFAPHSTGGFRKLLSQAGVAESSSSPTLPLPCRGRPNPGALPMSLAIETRQLARSFGHVRAVDGI